MEPKTTINGMLQNNEIFVPRYQRAYSWDTPNSSFAGKTQVDTFYNDLKTFIQSKKNGNNVPYYFGHFLFEKTLSNKLAIIDGQQRLTTIEIFLSVLFSKLESFGPLSEDEDTLYENLLKRKSTYRFSTVEYDRQFFKDVIIDKKNINISKPDTESKVRIIDALKFFQKKVSVLSKEEVLDFIEVISTSFCTTHTVENESEAIQMFLFQNNRGKKPTNLEILKAEFMFHIHLYGETERDALIEEIKTRFENIYKSISKIEASIDEDSVLTYSIRVFFNSLTEDNSLDTIHEKLEEKESIQFIKEFSFELSQCFEYLSRFYNEDAYESIEIHSLTMLGGIGFILPFILKAYKFNLDKGEINQLCKSLESIVFRNRIIGTRANLITRINDVYRDFTIENKYIEPIIERIEYIKNAKSSNWWWAYWNRDALETSINGPIYHQIARFILWKYENYLRSQGKAGYKELRFDQIKSPQLEHIAPQNPSGDPQENGYAAYTDTFRNEYVDCLGNYLLLSGHHNDSISNGPFAKKRKTYNMLEQQKEILEMTDDKNPVWGKTQITNRKKKLIDFILKYF